MSTTSLQSIEEQLRGITSLYSLDDWEEHDDVLTRIRELTIKPRKPAAGRPRKNYVQKSPRSLEELLELPDRGQPSSGEAEPILDILEDEDSIVRYCRDSGLKPRATLVVKAVFRSLHRSEDVYADVWHGVKQFYNSEGSTASRLLDTQEAIAGEADVNGARYRINALLFAFEYRARCEALRFDESEPTKNKETAVLKRVMAESKKTSEQIQSLLKRGRFYAQWVNELGVGAILALGESLASNNYMTTIDQLVKVCKAIPGFCERSRSLSKLARKAIVQAIILSGQTAPAASQRYISYPGASPMLSNDGTGIRTSGIADRSTNILPSLQEVTEQSAGRVPTPMRFPNSSQAALPQQGEHDRNLQFQSHPDTEPTRRQGAIVTTAPMARQRYVDYSSTAMMPSQGQAEAATPGIVSCQALSSLPSIQEVNDQPLAGVPTPGSVSIRDPAALSQRFENAPKMSSQWQPDGELVRREETGAQRASSRPLVNADNSTHATLAEANEVPLNREAANHPVSLAQSCFTTIQGYNNVVAGGPGWDGTSYDTQGERFNPEFWPTFFPLYN